jgi:hypothetical protein
MCGQENNDNNVSVKTLVNDFFSNYFAFDSKLMRTVIPFFTKPGFITNRYIEGQRVSYAHPLRMYLIISLFYFFVWSLIAKDLVQESESQQAVEIEQEPPLAIGELMANDSAAVAKVRNLLSQESLRGIDSMMAKNDTLTFVRALSNNITTQEKEALEDLLSAALLDSLKNSFTKNYNKPGKTTDTISDKASDEENELSINVGEEDDLVEEMFDPEDDLLIERMFDADVYEISKNRDLTDQQVLDSLNLGELSPYDLHVAKQTIRVLRAEKEAIVGAIVQNLPVMMLFLIPVFALILKLLYVRRKFLYINHIIHGLHLHSFAYLVYGLTMILTYFILDGDSSSIINFISFVGVTSYCYFSFLRVYKQKWFKTFVKFNLTGVFYISLISLFLILELLISMLLY